MKPTKVLKKTKKWTKVKVPFSPLPSSKRDQKWVKVLRTLGNDTAKGFLKSQSGKNDTAPIHPPILVNKKTLTHKLSETSKNENVIRDTNDTNDTNDTAKKGFRIKRIKRIAYHDLVGRIGGNPKIKVLSALYRSSEKTRKKISEITGESNDYIRVLMNRSKDLFVEGLIVEGQKTFKLSSFGEKEIDTRLDNYERVKNMANKKKDETEAKEYVNFTIAAALDAMNPVIDGDLITIDYNELVLNFSKDTEVNLAEMILEKPTETIQTILDHYTLLNIQFVNIINLPKSYTKTVEELRAKDLEKLVVLEGRCVSLSTVRPIIINAKFECPSCGTIISIIQVDDKFREPSRCSCGRRGGFKVIGKDIVDASNVVIEDLQDNTENPNTQRINARIQERLTKKEDIKVFNLGEEVKVTGILKEVKSFVRGGESTNLGFLFEILGAEKKEEEIIVEKFNEKEVDEIKEIARVVNEEGMDAIVDSFAPDIYGYEYIKKAIMLQACNPKNKPKSSTTRNKQNILLIGDPGIAKSVLCKYAMDITPGSRKAAGGGSSAVGITASVVKEEESMGGYRIEAGALPLAKELLFLDEMNNLTDEDKPKLQEALSEQMISINKANLHVNLKVTAGVLATANPRSGHFIEDEDYVKQFNIPSPILNRFDIIFIMKDIPNTERDRAIAEIMIKRKKGEIKPEYSMAQFKRFFAYVRNSPEPKITKGISEKLKNIYADSRKNRNVNVIINPRFIEALSRMIEASAKMRLSKYVEEKDIERAMDILKESHFKINEYKHFDFLEDKK